MRPSRPQFAEFRGLIEDREEHLTHSTGVRMDRLSREKLGIRFDCPRDTVKIISVQAEPSRAKQWPSRPEKLILTRRRHVNIRLIQAYRRVWDDPVPQ